MPKMTTRDADKYPMCTRLHLNGDKRRELTSFLEWLRDEKKLGLCETDNVTPNGYCMPVGDNDTQLDNLVLEFLDIDVKALEKERRQLVNAICAEADNSG